MLRGGSGGERRGAGKYLADVAVGLGGGTPESDPLVLLNHGVRGVNAARPGRVGRGASGTVSGTGKRGTRAADAVAPRGGTGGASARAAPRGSPVPRHGPLHYALGTVPLR